MARVVACVLAITAIVAAVFAVVAAVIAHARGIPHAPGALDVVPLLLGVGPPAAVGAFLVLRRPRAVVGWILVVGALSVAASMAAWTASALLLNADRDSAPGAWLLLGSQEWLVFFAWPLALAYCYPDGRLPSPRWRPAARLAVVSCGGVMLLLLLQQPLDGPFGPVDNPLGVDAKTPALLAVFWACWFGVLISLFGGALALRTRYRAGDPVQRRQVLWLAYGAVLLPLWLGGTSLREGLAGLLEDAGHEVVGRAGDAEMLMALVGEHAPDLAVVDVRMPPSYDDEGTRAAAEIRRSHPSTAVLVLSQHIETRHIVELVAGGGGFGYLLKDRVLDVDDFLEAARRVCDGGSALDPQVVSTLVGAPSKQTALDELTPREREVLGLMAEGRTNAGIAKRLWLTEKTVETHIRTILMKLGLQTSSDDHRRVLAVLTYLRSLPPSSQG